MKLDMHLALMACGLDTRSRRTGPCPACGSTSTKHDSRPPIIYGKEGWRCVACKAGGDGYTLVGYHLQVALPLRGRAFRQVVEFVNSGKYPEVRPVEQPEPARIDPTPALHRAVPLSKCVDAEVLRWLSGRNIPTSAPAGVLRGFRSDWWPWDGYPLVVPACTGTGEVVSMHGRSVVDNTKRWPKGAEARELLFAPPPMRAWLRQDAPGPKALVITEGLSDYLTWSSISSVPTLGMTSGSASALRLVTVERGTKVFVGTHGDKAGDRYAEEVADALAMRAVVRRLPLERVHKAA